MNDKICGHILDKEQQAIVLDESNHLLVVAGAGSGKTLTILGKINYLIKYKNILPLEILCISFTKEAANSLKQKIQKEFNINIEVYTFHKLALNILPNIYEIADSNLLTNIIYKFFKEDILKSNYHMNIVLKYFNIYTIKNKKETYSTFYNTNQKNIIILSKLIETFIKLFKCNNYELDSFNDFIKEIKKNILFTKYLKSKYLLILILNIYLIYEHYLEDNSEIDFDDMIIKASDYIEKNRINLKYKYIIIDEYQDTSLIRFNLIKSILKYSNSKLLVVGDDFQSIYRFTGCDLSLFINFKENFLDAKVLKIQNTYRNSQELISLAGSFVMKNKYQISKNLKSSKRISKPIKIINSTSLYQTIIDVYHKYNGEILVLGRNNNDINFYLSDKLKIDSDGNLEVLNNNEIKARYLTVHKSKGLEADNIIMINMEDKLLGFPNKIKDDKIINLVNKTNEKYPYSEERRLFYVALTRTKNYVYILNNPNNESIFMKEIIKDYQKDIEVITL